MNRLYDVLGPENWQMGFEVLWSEMLPVARFGVQVELCQSGELSSRIPKLEPPTISR
jgi:hypothetical protein